MKADCRFPTKVSLMGASILAGLGMTDAHASLVIQQGLVFVSTFNEMSGSDTQTFDKFDENLGTLTRVTVEMHSELTGTVDLQGNGNGTETTFSGSFDLDYGLDDDLGSSFQLDLSPTISRSASCVSTSSSCSDFSAYELIDWDDTWSSTVQAELDLYTGAGSTFDLTAEALFSNVAFSKDPDPGPGSFGFQNYYTSLQGQDPLDNMFGGDRYGIVVTYEYTEPAEPAPAMPEPGTAVIFATGLAGLGWRRRKG